MKKNPNNIYLRIEDYLPLKGESKKRVDAFMKIFLKERGDLLKKLAHE